MLFNLKNKWSLFVCGGIILYIISWPFFNGWLNPFTWDTFGYYLYLPLIFIHQDLGIQDYSIIENLQQKQFISDTLYQIYQTQKGGYLIRYPVGLSILLAPFFLLGHLFALFTDFSPDGFSKPYQVALVIGALFYISGAIALLRKLLLKWFNDKIVASAILIVCLGTNYIHQATVSSTMPHMLLFFMYALILSLTIKWHKKKTILYAALLGFSIGLITISRPTDVIAVLIPVLWGVKSFNELKNKIKETFKNHSKSLLTAIFFGLTVVFIQMIYWKIYAGAFIFNSYNNPGEGLDLLRPHTIDFLFSFKKGWLVYSPIFVLAFVGFYYARNKKYEFTFPFIVFTIVNIYLVSSWTNWWYAGSFGQRSMVQSYVVFAFLIACFLKEFLLKKSSYKAALFFVIASLMSLNLFQIWQFDNGIIHKDRMTLDYYLAVFGKTSINKAKIDHLLLVDRNCSFEEAQAKYFYKKEHQFYNGFEKVENDSKISTSIFKSGKKSLKIDSPSPSAAKYKEKYKFLTEKDHLWFEISFWALSEHQNQEIYFYSTMWRKGKTYKPRWFKITEGLKKTEINKWKKYTYHYLTPHIRSGNDYFHIFFWNPKSETIFIDDLEIIKYSPENGIR